MILSNTDIETYIKTGEINIEPFDPARLNGASYTLGLGKTLLIPKPGGIVDARNPQIEYDQIEIGDDGYMIHPGEFVLASTAEELSISSKICARLDGRTTLARTGLRALQDSTHIEPGQTSSRETLEITNGGPSPIKLWAGIKFVKVIFQLLQTEAKAGYSGPYLGQSDGRVR